VSKPDLERVIEQYAMCPKWIKCSAPICPLDHDWGKRALLNDDPLCFYMTESVKDGARARFEMAGLGQLFELVSAAFPPMSARWARIRRQLEAAKLTGSRMDRTFPSKAA